jgi:hypothetical protein
MDNSNNNTPKPIISPITISIDNSKDLLLGDIELHLPVTKDVLLSSLEKLGIKGWGEMSLGEISADLRIASDISGDDLSMNIADKLYELAAKELLKVSSDIEPSKSMRMSADVINQLNYLAVKFQELLANGQGGGIEIFVANVEAKKNCSSLAELINLTYSENLNRLDVWPVYDANDYGDILVNSFKHDEHAEVFNRLKDSDDPADKAFAEHIEMLEKYADLTAFGKAVTEREGGVFTELGYLVGGDGLQEIFRGVQDIPLEYIVIEGFPQELNKLAKYIPLDADKRELDYLITKLSAMDSIDRSAFDAITDVGWNCSSIAEIINIIENLDHFQLFPAFDEEQYGELRLDEDWDDGEKAFKKLEISNDPADQALKKHFHMLNRAVEPQAYGIQLSKEESGVFTGYGYIRKLKEPEVLYRGVDDIPLEYRKQSPALDNPKVVEGLGYRPSVLAQLAKAKEEQRNQLKQEGSTLPTKRRFDPEL